jgi:hypothetical protein
MDKTDQWKTTASLPPTDGDDDTLAKRVSENWASSAPRSGRTGGQVLQRLRHGRVHVVTVENTRVFPWLIDRAVATRLRSASIIEPAEFCRQNK